MILFKFLPEARTSWSSQSDKLIEVVIFIWGVNIFCSSCIMIQNIFNKLRSICKKGDPLRQVAPNTFNGTVAQTLNTVGRYTKRKNEY